MFITILIIVGVGFAISRLMRTADIDVEDLGFLGMVFVDEDAQQAKESEELEAEGSDKTSENGEDGIVEDSNSTTTTSTTEDGRIIIVEESSEDNVYTFEGLDDIDPSSPTTTTYGQTTTTTQAQKGGTTDAPTAIPATGSSTAVLILSLIGLASGLAIRGKK